MDDLTHRKLMQLSATSRVVTADASDLPEAAAGAGHSQTLPLSDMLEMSLEALLSQFRRR